jgi:hypothetical protein
MSWLWKSGDGEAEIHDKEAQNRHVAALLFLGLTPSWQTESQCFPHNFTGFLKGLDLIGGALLV